MIPKWRRISNGESQDNLMHYRKPRFEVTVKEKLEVGEEYRLAEPSLSQRCEKSIFPFGGFPVAKTRSNGQIENVL